MDRTALYQLIDRLSLDPTTVYIGSSLFIACLGYLTFLLLRGGLKNLGQNILVFRPAITFFILFIIASFFNFSIATFTTGHATGHTIGYAIGLLIYFVIPLAVVFWCFSFAVRIWRKKFEKIGSEQQEAP
ncbi:MAG: hypothetical protein WC291_06150 [Thermodesulfovibrionales bacterium]|jgi:CBS domain containing-hemolysin-like protein